MRAFRAAGIVPNTVELDGRRHVLAKVSVESAKKVAKVFERWRETGCGDRNRPVAIEIDDSTDDAEQTPEKALDKMLAREAQQDLELIAESSRRRCAMQASPIVVGAIQPASGASGQGTEQQTTPHQPEPHELEHARQEQRQLGHPQTQLIPSNGAVTSETREPPQKKTRTRKT